MNLFLVVVWYGVNKVFPTAPPGDIGEPRLLILMAVNLPFMWLLDFLTISRNGPHLSNVYYFGLAIFPAFFTYWFLTGIAVGSVYRAVRIIRARHL